MFSLSVMFFNIFQSLSELCQISVNKLHVFLLYRTLQNYNFSSNMTFVCMTRVVVINKSNGELNNLNIFMSVFNKEKYSVLITSTIKGRIYVFSFLIGVKLLK